MRWIVPVVAAAALAACSRDAASPSPEPTPTAPPADVFDAISGADPILTAPSGARPAPAKTATAAVTAKLTSRDGPVPHCGILYSIESMQFEVVDVERGSVGPRPLAIAVGCPELFSAGAIKSFDVGTTYRLDLSQRYPSYVRTPAIDSADYWLESIRRVD